ncbi:MAG: TlpA disulfide reductase family protein [Eubacteriales bacterium]|nr:TlpA disulfide reductase family protein [Eubacteriales bacterium]
MIAMILGIVLAVGVLAGCQASSTATLTKDDVDAQIKVYLDAHFDELLDNYYNTQWGEADDTPTTTSFSNLNAFTAKTLDGGTFTQADLAKKDVTVINYWGLLCGYCIDEMPQIAEFAKTLPDNVQVITVCADAAYDDDLEVAKQILSEAGFEGVTLVGGEGDYTKVLEEIQYTPTTIFVDKNGNTVGEAIVGDSENLSEAFTAGINVALVSQGKPELK